MRCLFNVFCPCDTKVIAIWSIEKDYRWATRNACMHMWMYFWKQYLYLNLLLVRSLIYCLLPDQVFILFFSYVTIYCKYLYVCERSIHTWTYEGSYILQRTTDLMKTKEYDHLKFALKRNFKSSKFISGCPTFHYKCQKQ